MFTIDLNKILSLSAFDSGKHKEEYIGEEEVGYADG